VLFTDSTAAAQQPGSEFAAVRQIVRRAWSAYLADPGKAMRSGESGTVPAIDLLDDEVDLTPGSRLRPAPVGITAEPRDLVAAAEDIRATLGALADSLPRLRVAGQDDLVPARAALEDLVRSGAAEIHRPGPQAVPGPGKPGTGHFDAEVTSQDVLRGRPPSGAVPLDPQAGEPTRVRAGHTPRTVVAATATASSPMTAGTAPREGHAAIPRFRMVALLADGLRYRADRGQSRA
jgi:hypothetical protein